MFPKNGSPRYLFGIILIKIVNRFHDNSSRMISKLIYKLNYCGEAFSPGIVAGGARTKKIPFLADVSTKGSRKKKFFS